MRATSLHFTFSTEAHPRAPAGSPRPASPRRRSSWGSLGGLFGASWRPPGFSWGHPGGVLAVQGVRSSTCVFAPLGPLLGSSFFGGGGRLGGRFCRLGALLGRLVAPWGLFWPSWSDMWGCLGSYWPAELEKARTLTSRNTHRNDYVFCFSGPSWGAHGASCAVLGASWAVEGHKKASKRLQREALGPS